MCLLPDTDSSSVDELSLCCLCKLFIEEAFTLGTASVSRGRKRVEGGVSVGFVSDLGLCMSHFFMK